MATRLCAHLRCASTALCVAGMVERKRGAIINISSAAGRIPIGNPMYAEYSATKAYV
ncbi:SDR family NAD(P)-dependent oxidoreductase, partial [archaeon]